MKINGLLPVGSVVQLKEGTKKIMIMGLLQQKLEQDSKNIYDYVGVPFPEGFQSAEMNYLFNSSQIDKLFFIGYQDDESLAYKERVDSFIDSLRKKEQENGLDS